MTIETKESNPYTCCDIENCQCTQAPSSANSCSIMKKQLTPGVCGNGYECCH